MITTVNSGKVRELYVLARVFNIYSDPGISFYADPWKLHVSGLMELESKGGYQGYVHRSAPTMAGLSCLSSKLSSNVHDVYKGLDIHPGQIRLLKLDLNDDDAVLSGELKTTNVESNSVERFWAISYVWGPPPTVNSPCIFKTEQGVIPITESLSTCLKQLRAKKVDAYIWADALCINQQNKMEKSAQVRRMGSLYGAAERVVIWMGDGHGGMTVDSLFNHRNLSHDDSETEEYRTSLLRQMVHLLEKPWFKRTWIIQELVRGKRNSVYVMCGGSEILWEDFMEMILTCKLWIRETDSNDDSEVKSSGPALALNRVRHEFQDGTIYSLLELLDLFYYTTSSRPRDKLFALLSLAHDVSEKPEFHPDYDSSEETILQRYAKGFVQGDKGLDLLYYAGAGKSTKFSSWIPDLMNHRRNNRFPPSISTWPGTMGVQLSVHFKASPPQRLPQIKMGPIIENLDSNSTSNRPDFGNTVFNGGEEDSPKPPAHTPILHVEGYSLGYVSSLRALGIKPSAAVSFTEIVQNLRQYLAFLDRKRYPESDALEGQSWMDDLIAKLLTGDAKGPYVFPQWPFAQNPRNPDVPNQNEFWTTEILREVMQVRPGQNAYKFMSNTSPRLWIWFGKFWSTVVEFTGRIPEAAAFFTDNGYVGILPGTSRQGDKIFIPYGAKVPFVLRPEENSDKYSLIGECYIQGAMYGEYDCAEMKAETVSLI